MKSEETLVASQSQLVLHSLNIVGNIIYCCAQKSLSVLSNNRTTKLSSTHSNRDRNAAVPIAPPETLRYDLAKLCATQNDFLDIAVKMENLPQQNQHQNAIPICSTIKVSFRNPIYSFCSNRMRWKRQKGSCIDLPEKALACANNDETIWRTTVDAVRLCIQRSLEKPFYGRGMKIDWIICCRFQKF